GSDALLLGMFLQQPGVVLDRDTISDATRGRESLPMERGIDVQISRLRRLIEPDPSKPRYIQTVWGVGYVFVPDGNK
ncbi:winged helix-turn-helix domain-containing protein, partial [Escherichia coli]